MKPFNRNRHFFVCHFFVWHLFIWHLLKKTLYLHERLLERHPFNRQVRGKNRFQPRWKTIIKQHKNTSIIMFSNQAPEGLLQTRCNYHIIIKALFEELASFFVENIGFCPRHFIKSDEAERATGHVHSVPQGVGAEQACVFIFSKNINQGRKP